MRKMSKDDLNALKAGGLNVKRKMGASKPKTKVSATPNPKLSVAINQVPMASMQASMQHLESQAEATRVIIAHNSEVIKDFKSQLSEAVSKVGRKVPYVHDIERGKDKLITRIVSTPKGE